MSSDCIKIYNSGVLVDATDTLTDYLIGSNYLVVAGEYGTASGTIVSFGGTFSVCGSTVAATTVAAGALMTVSAGAVQKVTVRNSGLLEVQCSVTDITLKNGGTLTVHGGGSADTVLLDSGAACLRIENGGSAAKVTQNLHGSTVTILSGGTLNGLLNDGADATVENGGLLLNTTLRSYTAGGGLEEEKDYSASLILRAGARHCGTLTIDSHSGVTAETGSVIDFTLTERTPGENALINDLSRITGSPDYTLTVRSDQEKGSYVLAGEAAAFSATITVQINGKTAGSLSLAQSLITPDRAYSLSLEAQTLSLVIADSPDKPHDLTGNADGISWQSTAEKFTVQYSRNDFASALSFETRNCGVDTYAMSAGNYNWSVRNEGASDRVDGNAIIAEYTPEQSTAWSSDDDGICDLFFANAAGTWSTGYAAQHLGDGIWEGTGERVKLAGKNRIADTFDGSDDANILVLTDGECGDALFVDDLYTAFPGTESARIAQIDEIRAGAGNDIIDMTSRRFGFQGDGVLIRGGDGDDTIWAAGGKNILLGDGGNDRIVGASGSDVIAGGTGNDDLHGGGGDDVFCFCADWGSDRVEQLDGAGITLWFENSVELAFESSGTDTVITSALGSITVINRTVSLSDCRFGSSGYEEEFARLSAAGAFQKESSTFIYAEI